MNAPLPADEVERLQTLRSYNILDTPPEVAFERITTLAAQLFNVPIVLVSLVDSDRQWFKSCFGTDMRQTSRELSFCAYAILTNEVFVVPDATVDSRFIDNALVTGPPYIRSYAGAPLRAPDGQNLGSLCLIDTAFHQFRSEQLEMLNHLASIVVDELELRRTARELRESEAALREMSRENRQLAEAIANSTSGVIITDPSLPDNPIIFSNVGFQQMTGYRVEEVKGRNCRILQGPGTDPKTVHEIREAIADERPWHGMIYNYRREGTPFWNEVTISPVYDQAGRLINYVGLQNDVTERRKAEERLRASEERFRVLVENVRDYAIFRLDSQGHIISWNAGAQNTTGYSANEIIGQHFSRFYTSEDIERNHPQNELCLAATAGRYEEEGWRVRKDGSRYWANVVITSLRDETGQACGFAKVTRDITERRNAEEALRQAKLVTEQLNAALEERVQERTAELADSQIEILTRLARAAEFRDDNTGQHTQRVARTAALIAQELGLHPEQVDLILQAAPLHDVGKIAISDMILLKPGKLTDEEFDIMRSHAAIGATLLSKGRSEVVQLAERIAGSHHERWDGMGYPLRLAGTDIPIEGRILAVADVFDALTHKRSYKKAWPVAEAVAEIAQQSGRQFDPQVVEAFLKLPHKDLGQDNELESIDTLINNSDRN